MRIGRCKRMCIRERVSLWGASSATECCVDGDDSAGDSANVAAERLGDEGGGAPPREEFSVFSFIIYRKYGILAFWSFVVN